MTDGEKGGLAILVVAGVYDLWALRSGRETISEAAYRHRRWIRWAVLYLGLHFEKLIPAEADPLRRWW